MPPVLLHASETCPFRRVIMVSCISYLLVNKYVCVCVCDSCFNENFQYPILGHY